MNHQFTFVWLLFLMIVKGHSSVKGNYRLPLQVTPQNYEISLIPYLVMEGQRNFTFDGTVNITVKAITNAPNITLNANMEITNVSSSSLKIREFSVDEFLNIELENPLKEQSVHNITIHYTGELTNDRKGFYRSSYVTSEGDVRWLATTHFEPIGARRAFPCFDEPALKATFVIRIAPPTGYHAVSNMPVESISEPDPNTAHRVWYNFKRTPIMSTYLVAFVVSQFASIVDGKFQVFGDPENIEKGRNALAVSPKILNILENLTGFDYPLPKLDQVAVPDFEPAAMENWGLITYKDNLLLNGKGTLPALGTMAHEFSHNWFGNLVSPAWWKYLWLNEAFAKFFQYLVAQEVAPRENFIPGDIVEMQLHAMDREENILSRPLSADVEFPWEINSLFDLITYSKGSSIVKMTQHFLTPTTFLKGLQIYLKRMAYKSATEDDLFAALQEAATENKVLSTGLTVKAILETWTLQAGYPLLTVKRDYEAGTASITQSAYKVSCKCPREKRWFVPITYTTRKERDFNNTTPKMWLSPEKGSEVVLKGLGKDDWLILNILCSGYYRVNYDSRNWELLLSALEQPAQDGIHPINRAQIISDSQSLSKNKIMPVKNSLDILIALREDTDPRVQKHILKKMTEMYYYMNHLNQFSQVKKIFQPNLQSMLLTREDQVTLNVTDMECWKYALSDSTEVKVDGKSCPAEWCAAMRLNSGEVWDVVWNIYTQNSSPDMRRDALAALGCAKHAQRLLSAVLSNTTDEEHVFEEDRAAAITAPCGSETRAGVGGGGAAACLQAVIFLAKNMRTISILLGDTDDFLNLARNIASKLQTEEQYEMLRFAAMKHYDRESSPLTTDMWRSVLQIARARLDSIQENVIPIKAWLLERADLY